MSSLASPPTPEKNYNYVFLPCSSSETPQLIIGDGSGGLESDLLITNCKKFFSASGQKPLSINETNALAQAIRDQAIAHGADKNQLKSVSDEALIALSQSTTCEITALTVPCAKNKNIAVSMYTDDKARTKNLALNIRATTLSRACGHGEAEIFGDAFVSRYHDDEMGDIWERVNFTIADSLPSSSWCKLGGGGTGKGTGSSLSTMMAKAGGTTSVTENNANAIEMGKVGGGGVPVDINMPAKKGDNFTWSQSTDDVELRFVVDGVVTAKNIKAHFSAKNLKVFVIGVEVVSGELGGPVMIDDCVWTLEAIKGDVENEGKKVLAVTLAKRRGGDNWDFAVKAKE